MSHEDFAYALGRFLFLPCLLILLLFMVLIPLGQPALWFKAASLIALGDTVLLAIWDFRRTT